jgi:hypothetical protein
MKQMKQKTIAENQETTQASLFSEALLLLYGWAGV